MHDSYPKDCRRVVLDSASSVTRLTQDTNWVYVRRSEEIQDVLWRSCTFNLCLGSKAYGVLVVAPTTLIHKICSPSWKVSKYGVISGPYFPAFGLNTERCFVSLRIHSECGKMRTRLTPYLDIFHAVIASNTRPWNKDLLRKYHL